MGFLDALLGGRGKTLKGPAPDRLFAMTTAQVTLETGLGPEAPRGGRRSSSSRSAPPTSSRSSRTPRSCCASSAEDTGSKIETADDEFGYRWLILRDPDFEDLVVSLNTVSTELQGGGYGDRLLAAVFAFEEEGRPLYFIYNFKRGAYYPFVPARASRSATPSASCASRPSWAAELPFEEDMARWFPLWEIPL